MNTTEAAWRAFVESYDVHVPAEAFERELEYVTLHMRHNMQYDRLSGGDLHLFPNQEIAQQQDQLRAVALFEAKEPLVLKDLIVRHGFSATPQELEAEAMALAQRQGSTLDELKRFFGDDLALLERDVIEAKARAWAVSQLDSGA